jgi:hypothetical protein
MKTYETPGGKTIQLKYKEGSALIKVEFATGGELPADLSGLFTDEAAANTAVLKYLDRTSKKKSEKE